MSARRPGDSRDTRRPGRGRGTTERGAQDSAANPADLTGSDGWNTVPSRERTPSRRRAAGRSRSRGGRGNNSSTLAYRSSALGQEDDASEPIIEPTEKEPVHEYKGIRFIYNGELPESRYKQMNKVIDKWVDDHVRKDGTIRKIQYRKDAADWKPKYALVSKQGPHSTTSLRHDNTPNPTADKRLHNTLTLMDERDWRIQNPVGQDLHIYVDEKKDYIPVGKDLLTLDKGYNHSWGKSPNKQITRENRPYIDRAKARFAAGFRSTSRERAEASSKKKEEKKAQEQAEEVDEAPTPDQSPSVVSEGEDDAGNYYWKYNDGSIVDVNGRKVVGYNPKLKSKGKGRARPPPTQSSSASGPSTQTSPPQSNPATVKSESKTKRTSTSPPDDEEEPEKRTGSDERKYKRIGNSYYRLSRDGKKWEPIDKSKWVKYCKKK